MIIFNFDLLIIFPLSIYCYFSVTYIYIYIYYELNMTIMISQTNKNPRRLFYYCSKQKLSLFWGKETVIGTIVVFN